MKTNILSTLLTEKIDPNKFKLFGTEIQWLVAPTADELALVADIIANYDTLETTAQEAAALKADARADLDKSDITILRCYENGVTVPETWQTYRTELRAIISRTSSATSLPTRPDYPEGT